MSDRTFRIDTPHMKGDDIKAWQREVKRGFDELGILDCPIVADGIYGVGTRSYTSTLCHAIGMHATEVMKNGITPQLRSRIRTRDLTDSEEKRFVSEEYKDYRRALRVRWGKAKIKVHTPVTKILADSWGYHPGVHDGLDVICPPNSILFAMVRSKVIDVRAGNWWGKAPSGDVAKGDGIIQLEVLDSIGPFHKGHHIGYGHAEHARVREGDVVEAGEPIGRAGLAVAWHIHLMYNDGSTEKGVGNIDPRSILNYAVAHH